MRGCRGSRQEVIDRQRFVSTHRIGDFQRSAMGRLGEISDGVLDEGDVVAGFEGVAAGAFDAGLGGLGKAQRYYGWIPEGNWSCVQPGQRAQPVNC